MSLVLPDWEDPCDVYAKLRDAHHALLTGQSAARVRYTSGGGQTEEIELHKADMRELNRAMMRAKAQCEALSAKRPARHAITLGKRRF